MKESNQVKSRKTPKTPGETTAVRLEPGMRQRMMVCADAMAKREHIQVRLSDIVRYCLVTQLPRLEKRLRVAK